MKTLFAAIRGRGPLTVGGVHWWDLEAVVKEHKPLFDQLCVKVRRWKEPTENDLGSFPGDEVFVVSDEQMPFFRACRGVFSRPWHGLFPTTNAVFNARNQIIGLATSEWRETTFECEGMLITLRSGKRSYEDAHHEWIESEWGEYFDHFTTIPDICSCKVCHPG